MYSSIDSSRYSLCVSYIAACECIDCIEIRTPQGGERLRDIRREKERFFYDHKDIITAVYAEDTIILRF